MQESVLISEATRKNWERLGKDFSNSHSQLSKRANKRYSTKNIMPLEYFTNPETLEIIDTILTYNLDITSTIYSLAINLLASNNLINLKNDNYTSENEFIIEILDEFETKKINRDLLNIELPKERDLLGIVYQCLMSEGSKNIKGSYYTPQDIIKNTIKTLNSSDKFLDPCCGTGSFLIEASSKINDPQNIYGCDLDKTACLIAKINLILKYPKIKFRPNIFHCDFLLSKKFNTDFFDIIATNPPWGAITSDNYKKSFTQIKSDEIFSYFIIQSGKFLKPDGNMHLVLPESILNVKTHQDIRKFILDNMTITTINLCGKAFAGVLTDVIILSLTNKNNQHNEITIKGKKQLKISQKYYEQNPYNKYSILDNTDARIIDKIYSIPYNTLKNNAIWGLGIVTGDNKKHISKNTKKLANPHKIYTGKNIKKDEITETNDFIDYQRDKFQQAAPDSIYYAKEKLVYKFISKKLIFAYDNKQRLFLNSANILIPKLENYEITDVMIFLNSTLFQYIYTKRFNELKILKNNLLELPFPILDKKDLKNLTDEKIFKIFNLNQEEISYIKKEVGAK